LLLVASAHLVTVFSATLFSFFSLFALVGLLTLLLPACWLRPVSVAVRILLAVLLIVVFFSNFVLQLFSGHLPKYANAYLRWLPSIWFVGVYEKAVGIATPMMQAVAHRALLALAASVLIMVISYTLCYRRHFLRLAESFDNLAGNSHGTWFKMPKTIGQILFRSPFEEACLLFAFRVMTRSERHVLFLGGYVGIGLVIVAQSAATDLAQIPLLLAFFLITGLRMAFDIPATTAANWAFRFSANDIQPSPNSVARRLMMMLVLPWQFMPVGSLWLIPLNLAFSIVGIESLLSTFECIPFTYRVQTDSRKLVVRFVLALVGILFLVPCLVWIEHSAIGHWGRYAFVMAVAAAVWFELRRRRLANETHRQELSFEQRAPSEFELIKLA
jgi:hypothetical protein